MKIHYSAPMMVIILLILFIMYQQSQVSMFADSTSSSSQVRWPLVKDPLRSNILAISEPQVARQVSRMADAQREDILRSRREKAGTSTSTSTKGPK
jgi:hypothetical protein